MTLFCLFVFARSRDVARFLFESPPPPSYVSYYVLRMAAIATFSIDCSLSILLIAVVSFSFFFVSRIRYPRAPVHQITSALRTVACAGDFVLALDSLVLYWGREEVMLDMLVYCRRGNALLKRIYARVSTTFLLPSGSFPCLHLLSGLRGPLFGRSMSYSGLGHLASPRKSSLTVTRTHAPTPQEALLCAVSITRARKNDETMSSQYHWK